MTTYLTPSHLLPFPASSTQKNMEMLKLILDNISDPDSAHHGQHLSKHEIARITSNPESKDSILQFLNETDVSIISVTSYGEYITARAPIFLWEHMFNNKFYYFHYNKKGDTNKQQTIRAENYSIPSVLHSHVASVFNIVDLPIITKKFHVDLIQPVIQPIITQNISDIKIKAGYNGYVTPQILKSYYNIPRNLGTSTSTSTSSAAIYATLDQHYSPSRFDSISNMV